MGLLRWLALVPAAASFAGAVFTPEKLISAPRRGDALPNPSGKLALYSTSAYSFETHSRSSWYNLLDISSGKSSILTNDSAVGEIVWVDDKTLLYTNGTTDVPGAIELWITTIDNFARGYKAASIPAPLENLKIAVTKSGDINFLLTGKANADGTPYNEELAGKSLSTARVYDSIYVRHWDTWLTPQKYALFSGTLTGNKAKGFNGKLNNLLTGIKGLAETPVQPFGSTGDFAITPDGKTVAFLTKDPQLPQANYTASYIYLVPHDGSSVAKPVNAPTSKGTPKNARGASAAPVFSPDGKWLAYLQMDRVAYESDKNKIYITRVGSGVIKGVAHNWDRSATAVTFSNDGNTLFIQAEEHGRGKLFSLPTSAGSRATPKVITNEGYVSSFYQISDRSLLVSNSSMVQSTGFAVVSSTGGKASKVLLDPRNLDSQLAGLADDLIEEFWYPGNWTQIHGWIIKPSNFDPKRKYPLAFLIHGGPQGSWANSWSTRWNPAVWADQGYVAVAINPTGSTGYGQKLTDAIQNDWGGAPYDDLVKGFEYVAGNYDYIDTENAVAAGASYGGYMINWIQGQPLGRKFKALVTHDGAYSTLDQYSSEELWFVQHDFNGTLWDNRENYERWDPARFAINWATPHLVVHNDLDFRLPISEGIAMFNILQERGVPSRFLNFPDENHWVLNPENSLVWHKEALGWVNKWSGVNGTV
ncbi:secreted dipeptidyl peptidase [Sphaerosporella brunnea]|uniref:Dipeptidyl-peptidase V n=1 Tax=Sphaerosporella brunnea TaxID=1250544 RepID=A0A5J5ETR6_9PEZI|nr:secreted dipeptidyl peptidase [Sphaerosporella brunnea]